MTNDHNKINKIKVALGSIIYNLLVLIFFLEKDEIRIKKEEKTRILDNIIIKTYVKDNIRYFKNEDILYYRKNNILYMETNNIKYWKENTNYYKNQNNIISIDPSNTFISMNEIDFKNNIIISLLEGIKNILNYIIPNDNFKCQMNKIIYYSSDHTIIKFINLNNIFIYDELTQKFTLKDLWEFYYENNYNFDAYVKYLYINFVGLHDFIGMFKNTSKTSNTIINKLIYTSKCKI